MSYVVMAGHSPSKDGRKRPCVTAIHALLRSEEDVEKEMAYARRYLNTDGHDINWVMIRTLMASVANTALFPLQDVLAVGSEGRMNLPGSSSGNWRWRFQPGSLTPEISARLKEWADTYER